MTVAFSVPAPIIYKSMTDQVQICQFTRCLALSELQVGGKLEMFDGSIQAVYEEIVENERLKMKWKFKEWPDYGDCVVTFHPFNDSCEVKVAITGIPSHDNHGQYIHIENIQNGWRQNIFKMIHMVFGYPLRDE